MNIKIKGTDQVLDTLQSKVNTKESFQKQIETLQSNLNKCQREISAFDVYHITKSITSAADFDAVMNTLIPGEAAVYTGATISGDSDFVTGTVWVKTSALGYVKVEPFSTGTYKPSIVGDTITWTFQSTEPSSEEQTLTFPLTTESISKYYGSSTILGNLYDISKGEASFAAITNEQGSQMTPICRFYLHNPYEEKAEEVIIDYTLTLNTDRTQYSITTIDQVSDLFLGVK